MPMTTLTQHVPPGQFGRYLLIGVWNTLFGYGLFALLTFILDPRVPHGYILASILANLASITVAFLGYKWFVFRTAGNYFREWLRCLLVYGSGAFLGTLALPVLVFLIRQNGNVYTAAPYIAGGMILAGTTIYNFIGHKQFTFREVSK